jgi:hypothetical protein
VSIGPHLILHEQLLDITLSFALILFTIIYRRSPTPRRRHPRPCRLRPYFFDLELHRDSEKLTEQS